MTNEEIFHAYLAKVEALNLATLSGAISAAIRSTEYQAGFRTILSEAIIATIRDEGEKPTGKK